MAKRVTQFCAGRYYHFFNRGARKISLFYDDCDYLWLLKLVKHYSQ